MPNSFSGTFFNRHRIQCESGALNTNFSRIYYFLPSITDRVEEINRHTGSVNLLPIDISEDTFEVDGMPFDPSKLDYDNPHTEKMTQAVAKMLKKVVHLSNSNLIKNADGLLSKRTVEHEVEWIRKDKKRLPDNPYIRCPTDFF